MTLHVDAGPPLMHYMHMAARKACAHSSARMDARVVAHKKISALPTPCVSPLCTPPFGSLLTHDAHNLPCGHSPGVTATHVPVLRPRPTRAGSGPRRPALVAPGASWCARPPPGLRQLTVTQPRTSVHQVLASQSGGRLHTQAAPVPYLSVGSVQKHQSAALPWGVSGKPPCPA